MTDTLRQRSRKAFNAWHDYWFSHRNPVLANIVFDAMTKNADKANADKADEAPTAARPAADR